MDGEAWPSLLCHGSVDARSLLGSPFYHLHDHKVGEKTHAGSVIQAVLHANTSNIQYILENGTIQ